MVTVKAEILGLIHKYFSETNEISTKRIFNLDGSIILVPVLMANELRLPSLLESEKIGETRKILEREKVETAQKLLALTKNVYVREAAEKKELIVVPKFSKYKHLAIVDWCLEKLFQYKVISPFDVEYRSELESEAEELIGTRIEK